MYHFSLLPFVLFMDTSGVRKGTNGDEMGRMPGKRDKKNSVSRERKVGGTCYPKVVEHDTYINIVWKKTRLRDKDK